MEPGLRHGQGCFSGSGGLLLGIQWICCPRIPKEQTTDNETKGINRDFEIREM